MKVNAHRQVRPTAETESTETAQYFFQASGESNTAEQQGENHFRVQPVVEKETQQATENHRADNGERKFHRQGYSAAIFLGLLLPAPAAQAIRREIVRQEKHQKSPSFKRVLTAVGVDRANGEVWMAVGNTLLHFDKEGTRRASYQIYTPEGARLEANAILIEPDRMIIGGDPLGVYEFDRPEKKSKP